MSQKRQRVVWAEGLFLGQQHFQQWDRNLQREIHQRTDLARSHGWGVVSLNLLEEPLGIGQCRIESLSAILPNGQWVQFDSQRDGDPLLCDLTAGGDSVTVWLAGPTTATPGQIDWQQALVYLLKSQKVTVLPALAVTATHSSTQVM